MDNLSRNGTAMFNGKNVTIRIFVQNDDCMICVDNAVFFINIRYGSYFQGELISLPMSTRVDKMLNILSEHGVKNIYHKSHAVHDIGLYKVPIPHEINNIEWKGEPTKNGRNVRSNYQCFGRDVFESLSQMRV